MENINNNNLFILNNADDILLFKKIIKTFKNYSDYINFEFFSNYINIQIMDDMRISIINIFLYKNYFYDFNIQNQTKITLNINDLNKILKFLSKDDTIYFKLEKNYFYIKNDNNNNIHKIYKLNILDYNYDWIDINKIQDFTENQTLNIINIESKILQNIFSELYNLSDDLIINKKENENKLSFLISNDTSSLYSKYEINNLSEYRCNIQPNINLKFSLKNLNNFKLLTQFNNINLILSDEHPLYLNLLDNENKQNSKIEVKYILGPSI